VDWKPERAVQAKVRDVQNKRKIKQNAWLLRRANGGTLCVGLQMTTSSRHWVNNGLYLQGTSVATIYRVLPRQRLDLFTIISSPRKFAECLYCDVTPPPILPVLSHRVSLIICNYTVVQSSTVYTVIQVTFIHTLIQLYIHTLILSYINAYTACIQISFMHGCIVSLILILQKVSSIMCLSQKCYQSCILQVAGPTKIVVYQCLFISLVFSPVLVVTPLR